VFLFVFFVFCFLGFFLSDALTLSNMFPAIHNFNHGNSPFNFSPFHLNFVICMCNDVVVACQKLKIDLNPVLSHIFQIHFTLVVFSYIF